jgi:hypothetical protein
MENFVQAHDGLVHVPLWIGQEVHRPFAVTLIIRRIEAVVVKMGQRKLELMKPN